MATDQDNNGQSLNKSVPCSDSTTHLVEIPTSAHDKASAVCGIDCQPDWKIELDIEGNDTSPTIALEIELWCSRGPADHENGVDPVPNARRMGSTLLFRAPMVTVEEAEPSWHALDCGGALQVTAYVEEYERKR